MVDCTKYVKLTAAEFDPSSTLNFKPEYYECSVCMSIPPDLSILECPVCACRSCKTCLQQFTSKQQAKVQKGNYQCVICNKEFKMKETNKMMIKILQQVIKFECALCNRYWSFAEFATHKAQGQCRKDPSAPNNIQNMGKGIMASQSTSSLGHYQPQPVKPSAPVQQPVQ